jgi:hypothetical protein
MLVEGEGYHRQNKDFFRDLLGDVQAEMVGDEVVGVKREMRAVLLGGPDRH